MTPTTEELNAKFDELSHTDIEKERVWFWYGIATYTKLVSELAHEDWLKCKAEMQQEINGYTAMQDSKPAYKGDWL